jgi:hydrogenase large subunit
MGRTAARAIESKLMADMMEDWLDALLANIAAGDFSVHNAAKWDPSSWPSTARGVGFLEAPRGALGHWMIIRDGKINNYQAVVPTTWNAGPKDGAGAMGAYEAALCDNHSLADHEQPLEIIRTVHSFDPCIACAVHVTDPDGKGGMEIRVG